MSDPESQAAASTGSSAAEALRALPAVNELLERPGVAHWIERLGRSVVVGVMRGVLDTVRAEILGQAQPRSPEIDALMGRIETALACEARPPLRPLINATGILIHTGLGRAPLAEPAVEALADAARGYAPVELEIETGARGHRADIVRELLCRLTGAESATVVNNNAAALVLSLAALAHDRSVIVSRGELIEIGGSFRLPQIMAASGAQLREVGTTNKTRLADYERAIDHSVAAILKVHPSNYRIDGFSEAPAISDLVELGHAAGLPVLHDVGSGLLRRGDHPALMDEPDATTSIAAGADLVMFSGDKLLGGPQAGILVGRAPIIARIEKHPLMRAMRVDKLTLSALAVTLQLHLDADRGAREVPIHRMLHAPIDELRTRATALADRIDELPGLRTSVVDTEGFMGGGASPAQVIPSVAVEVRTDSGSVDDLAMRLRTGEPGVLVRVCDDALRLDLRTIFPGQDEQVAAAIHRAAAPEA